jgi:hypothetical protein
MFRAIAALKKSEGFEVTNHSDYVTKQTKTFTKQYPNLYPTPGNYNSSLTNDGLQTWDPNTRQSSLRDIDITTYAKTLQESQTLAKLKSDCATATIDNVSGLSGQNDTLRCGWVYKKGVQGNIPAVSRGALGVRGGPIDPQALTDGGKWYWNIDEVKKDILIDRCSALNACQDVGSSGFQGCAYSTQRGSGIPVNTNGSVKFPNDIRFSGNLGTLITQASQCPTQTIQTTISDLVDTTLTVTSSSSGRDTCIPDASGKLPRDCYLDQIKLAGCSDNGTLYNALSLSTNPSNYFDRLADKLSYKKYQELATAPLMESTLKTGQATASTALQNFAALKAATFPSQNTAISFAARDLCLEKGLMDTFDFCSELTSTTAAPFSIECLQKAFRQAGGQETGNVYPSNTNISQWNSFGTWGNVINKINELKQNLNSSREEIQRDAMANFLGIRRTPYELGQIGKIPGIELFWFNSGTNTFIGRRLTGGLAAQFPRISNNTGEIEKTRLADNVEYLAMVNLRPLTNQSVKLKIKSDDGFMYGKNKIFSPVDTKGQVIDANDLFGANKGQSPTEYTQTSCWDLKAGGPNYINGYWEEQGGSATFELAYSPCNQNSWQIVPPEWMSLTQEPDAPMVSFQVDQNGIFQERRIPYFFDLRVTGGTVSDRNTPGYPYLKELKLGSRSASATLMKNVSFNSWRSISMSFFASENTSGSTSGYLLFKLGDAITVRILGKDVIVNVNTATLPNVTKRFTNVIDNTNTIPNYLFINCKRDSGQTQGYPNRITIAVGTMFAFLSGNISVETPGNNMATYTTVGNQPVFTATDSAELSLGDRSAVSSAICTIGSVRLFDYQMDTNDIQRDIKNEWKMKFL